jgi:hypothetical protein
VDVSPGRYRLSLKLQNVCCEAIEWGEIDDPPGGVTVTLDSGISLFEHDVAAWYPHKWTIVHPATGDGIGRAEYPTRFVPLPPGDYVLKIDAEP